MADNRNDFEAQYFSRVHFNDQDGRYRLSFKYWKGQLCFTVDEWIQGGGDNGNGEYKNVQRAFFSPYKALCMVKALDVFIGNDKCNPVGVDLGAGDVKTCVTFTHGKDGNVVIKFCDINPDGSREKEFDYTLSTKMDFSIEYTDYAKMKWEKHAYPTIACEIIRNMLNQFYEAMLGGTAYSVMDYQRFHNNRVDSNMNKIMNQLGIQTYNSNNNYTRGAYKDSIFSGNSGGSSYSNSSSRSTTRDVEDFDSLLEE